ncbi:MAG TPA: peptidoglycan DD-metalloendopeptidase family protein [Methylocystis sp.]|nr:peptidoglycan DD-metalloendopeptidase family protein [Methylocystis sp.]
MARVFAYELFALALAGPALGFASFASPLRAETPSVAPEAPELSGKKLELRSLEDNLSTAGEKTRTLDSELQTIEADRQRLSQTLLEAAAKLRATEASAAAIETRLAESKTEEETILKSLQSRRALVGEVLLVLQRMGLHPPPALLARPEDILQAIRASMAIGAVLPQMRAETVALQSDLRRLLRLREDISAQKANLTQERDNLTLQRQLLENMLETRRVAREEKESARKAEAERMRALAGKATSIKELIARMEAESEAARKAAQAAKDADEARIAAEAALSREQRAKALAAPFKDPARLAPAAAFGDLRGRLPLPVVGVAARKFGAPDGYGGTEKGLSLLARENGVVVSPSDSWVLYAGPYRSYGQLLILNAGSGYYLVLAGMSRISVDVGQFVLAGEPVASMGDGSAQTAATIAIGAKKPVLYVEFRKDGASIDPDPWWARSDSRKVGG